MQEISRKDRMKIPRQAMPEQDPLQRSGNFEEVNLGFTEELAKMEALRCLQCPKPVCVDGCPVNVKIGDFIALVAEGDFNGAAAKLKGGQFTSCNLWKGLSAGRTMRGKMRCR